MFSVKLGNVAPLSDGGATSTPKEPLALLFPILPGGSRSRGVQRAASLAGSEFAHPRLRLQQRLLRSKDGNEKILASRFRYRTSCTIMYKTPTSFPILSFFSLYTTLPSDSRYHTEPLHTYTQLQPPNTSVTMVHCWKCNREFVTTDFMAHFDRAHPEVVPATKVRCTFKTQGRPCGKMCANIPAWKEHMELAHGVR